VPPIRTTSVIIRGVICKYNHVVRSGHASGIHVSRSPECLPEITTSTHTQTLQATIQYLSPENCTLLGYYAASSGNFLPDVSVRNIGLIFKDPRTDS